MGAATIDLGGRAAIVTGAGSGLGAGIALGLAGAGARVALVDRDPSGLAATAAAIRGADGECSELALDLTEPAAPGRAVEHALAAFGSLGILVHSACVFEQYPFAETTVAALDRILAINTRAPYLLSQAALPHLRPDGAIVFISSGAGAVGFPDASAYCLSKGAIWGLTRALAAELAGQGVRVNAIAPGAIDTPINARQFARPGVRRWLEEHTPSGRIGEVEDVVPAALFLVSDGARHVHGATVVIDGGWLAR